MTKDKKEKDKKKVFTYIYNSRFAIASFIVGLVIGLGIMSTQIPEQIAKLKDGSESIAIFGENDGLSADELYTELKETTPIATILDLIDAKLLESKYPYATYNEQAKTQAAEYVDYYKNNYNLDESDFLNYYGFSDMPSFIEFLTLDTQRYDYYHDVLKSKISESDKKKYYKNKVFGAIGAKYIAVTVDDDSKDDEKLIKEIQKKVNDGKTYDEIVAEYKDNSSVISADLNNVTFDAGFEEKFVNALRKLKDNSHSTKYVKTDTYGYTIIFRTTQQEKESYDEIDDVIEEVMIQEMDSNDPNLFYQTFINLRKDAGLKFTDTNYEKAYKDYIKKYK